MFGFLSVNIIEMWLTPCHVKLLALNSLREELRKTFADRGLGSNNRLPIDSQQICNRFPPEGGASAGWLSQKALEMVQALWSMLLFCKRKGQDCKHQEHYHSGSCRAATAASATCGVIIRRAESLYAYVGVFIA